MTRRAVIENNTVTNIIEAEPDFELPGKLIVDAGDAGIGWTWDGEKLSPPPEPEPEVPTVVYMRQARLALLGAGMYQQVLDFIASMGEPERIATEIEWEYATEVRRDHPLIVGIGHALDLTDEQIDDLFIAASQIE